MTIRFANDRDNEALLSLTRLSPMDGKIAVTIDRGVDFFALLHFRGKSVTLIAEEKNKVVAAFSVTQQPVRMANQITTLHYLADFKVHPDLRGTTVAARIVSAMQDHLNKTGADLLFCTAAKGNQKVLPFFSGRVGIPPWQKLGVFTVYQILPGRKLPAWNGKIEEASPLTFSLKEFYHRYFKQQYTLSPIIEDNQLEHSINLFATESSEVTAAISLSDTSLLKQHIVLGMPIGLKILVWLSKYLSPILKLPRLPGKGSPIRILYIRYAAHLPGKEAAFMALIARARSIALEKNFHFLSIGLHEQDDLGKVVKRFTHIPFYSEGYITSLQHHNEIIQDVLKGVPFEDFSMV